MGRDELLYLRHILDAIEIIEEYLRDSDEERFKATRLLQDGTIRQLEIIGEAVKKLSKDIRGIYPEVPWQDIAGMRDRLIYGYFGVDLEEVWDTAKQDLPALKTQIQAILKDFEE